MLSIAALALFAVFGGFAQAPLTADLSKIVSNMKGSLDEGHFELYRWDRLPSTLIFDMADFHEQNRMFSRLAFYLEKIGYRGRLLANSELEGKHGWNAHDYGAEGLAAFFNAAHRAALTLHPEEYLLENIALCEGILVRQGGVVESGRGGVLSICRESSIYERRLLLAHESYHGIFFASDAYRRFCSALWDCAGSDERSFIVALLRVLDYDSTTYRYLTVNEFQAYLLQQPSNIAASYFKRVDSLLQDSSKAPPIGRVLPQLLENERELGSFLKVEVRYCGRRVLFDGNERKMRRGFLRVALFLAVSLGAAAEAFAHPHVFIANTMHVVFDGHSLDHIEFKWVFDDLFSSMLLTDFDKNHTGRFTADEAAAIKKGAFDNLKNYHYFLAFSLDGRPIRLPPIEHFLPSISNGALVYTFRLPLRLDIAKNASHTVGIVIYDDTYYVAFDIMKIAYVALESDTDVDCGVSIEKTKVKAVWPGQYMPDQVVLRMKRKVRDDEYPYEAGCGTLGDRISSRRGLA